MQAYFYVRGDYGSVRTIETSPGLEIARFNTSNPEGDQLFHASITGLTESGYAIYDCTHGHAINTPAWAARAFA